MTSAPHGPMEIKVDPTIATYEGRRWSLAEGETLSLGRGSGNAIRIGLSGPDGDDAGVSRYAATVTFRGGRLWITNESKSRPVYIRRSFGPSEVLRARGDCTSLASRWVEASFVGHVRRYSVTFELPDDLQFEDEHDAMLTSRPTEAVLELSARERLLGAAACYDMFRSREWNVKASSYARMAELLRCGEHHARNDLDRFRKRIFEERNIPGVVGADAKQDFAAYLYESRTITERDIEALEEWGSARGGA